MVIAEKKMDSYESIFFIYFRAVVRNMKKEFITFVLCTLLLLFLELQSQENKTDSAWYKLFDKADALLKQNAVIQPCLFYITAKGNLMMGLPVENRAVTAAVLKRCTDFVSKRVADTKNDWQAD